jgi:hypothetical protein
MKQLFKCKFFKNGVKDAVLDVRSKIDVLL